jgi:general secretion pathway protein F
MPLYAYKATTLDGKVEEGYIEAIDQKAAIESVRQKGFIPIKVSEPKTKKPLYVYLKRKKKADLVTFTTELTALVGAGLPLDRSLQILSEISEDKETAEISRQLLESIKEGSSFSEALSRHPKVFPRIYINMVRAGEAGGVLDSVLEKLLEFLESTKQLKESVYSAMIYPVILTFTGGISIIILLTYVIPKFSQIFEDIGQSIPLPTQILISMSGFLSTFWWLLASVVVVGWALFRRYISKQEGRQRWDEFKLRLFGEVIIKLETARFCRTLGTLLKGGVPLLQALSNVKDVIGNTVIASSIEGVITGVREGEGMAGPMERTGIFPSLAVSMIRVGEETGQLDEMLLKVADTYEKSLRVAVKRFVSLLEPIMILIMGLIVGFIVISILVAIFSINEIPF